MHRLVRALRAIAILGFLTLVVFVVVRLVVGNDDGDDATPTVDGAVGTVLRPIEADGPVRLRWETVTAEGAQADLVVVVAEDYVARRDGRLERYRVGDQGILCFPGPDALVCELDPNAGPLTPSAGETTLAVDDAESRTIADRPALCWEATDGSATTTVCSDLDTGLAVLTETIDGGNGLRFRQTLVEWAPASASDLSIPAEVEALVG